MLTRSGKKITEIDLGFGFRDREATEVFFVEGGSFDECLKHSDFPLCGSVFEGWICVALLVESISDSVVKIIARFKWSGLVN